MYNLFGKQLTFLANTSYLTLRSCSCCSTVIAVVVTVSSTKRICNFNLHLDSTVFMFGCRMGTMVSFKLELNNTATNVVYI